MLRLNREQICIRQVDSLPINPLEVNRVSVTESKDCCGQGDGYVEVTAWNSLDFVVVIRPNDFASPDVMGKANLDEKEVNSEHNYMLERK